MTRRQALSTLAATAAAGLALRATADADGLIRFRNVSFTGGVSVEVRVGDTLDAAVLYGTQKIAKGDSWEVDTTGATAWWRRDASPGSNDGRYTAWQRVDSSRSDARVDI
jgi:predicted ATP-grasp superfamily ATP-dependent carboligase